MELGKAVFPAALAKAIASVLKRRGRKLLARTLDCLVIDAHPWSGFLNLSMRHTEDEAPRSDGSRVLVGDWEFSSFAVAHYPKSASGAWPEASGPLKAICAAYAAKPVSVSDDTFADRVYFLCAMAAPDPIVWDALGRFALAPGFSILVINVDSPARTIVVKRARRARTP